MLYWNHPFCKEDEHPENNSIWHKHSLSLLLGTTQSFGQHFPDEMCSWTLPSDGKTGHFPVWTSFSLNADLCSLLSNLISSPQPHYTLLPLHSFQTSSESGSFEILTPVGGLHNLFCWAKQKLNETRVSRQDVIENKDFKLHSICSSIAESLAHTLKLKGAQIQRSWLPNFHTWRSSSAILQKLITHSSLK